jgi:hypothetical protein
MDAERRRLVEAVVARFVREELAEAFGGVSWRQEEIDIVGTRLARALEDRTLARTPTDRAGLRTVLARQLRIVCEEHGVAAADMRHRPGQIAGRLALVVAGIEAVIDGQGAEQP